MSLKLVLARIAAVAVGLAAATATATATAALLQFTIQATNQYGSLSEFGDTTINIGLDPTFPGNPPGARFRCGSEGGFVQGPLIQLSAVVDLGAFSGCSDAEVNVGPLAAGTYNVTTTIYESDGYTAIVNSQVAIPARGAKCNVDPFQNLLLVELANKSAGAFQTLLATDSAYRDLLGPIAFVRPTSIFVGEGAVIAIPPLDDPLRVIDRLQRTGEFTRVEFDSPVCFSLSPRISSGNAIEYYSPPLDHYFFTADGKEQQALDAGMIAGGWVRTGKSFSVGDYAFFDCQVVEGKRHPVYRFTGEPNIGPDSHFFTVSQDECAVVRDRTEWHWIFEGSPFWASEPVAGTCPAGYRLEPQPLYRAYNNGKGGTPNHRYSTDQSVIDQMVAQGWVDEGIAMCIAGP
jgi:hypothetical protein